MTRNLFIFVATFVVGALAALVARAAMLDPHADKPLASAPAEYVPMVATGAAKTSAPTAPVAAEKPASATPPVGNVSVADGLVNTVCAICGMDVDPKLPTLEYKGKKIGFGCRMCPPKFKANPDRYGPYYLRNEVIGN